MEGSGAEHARLTALRAQVVVGGSKLSTKARGLLLPFRGVGWSEKTSGLVLSGEMAHAKRPARACAPRIWHCAKHTP